jgi:oligopeptide/dipeptide ABC transporter ATP-binding protein
MYAGKLVEAGACDAVYTAPQHPYTQALLSAALPLHPSVRRQRIVLSGEVPNPLRPPSGCRFHPRCPQAMPQCKTHEPVWKEVRSGHYAACHLVTCTDTHARVLLPLHAQASVVLYRPKSLMRQAR